MSRRCLVHLASGVGNVVLATPLLVALDELGYAVHVCLDADYSQTAGLLQPWSVVREVHGGGLAAAMRAGGVATWWNTIIPAVPPFYWHRYAPAYKALTNSIGHGRMVPRPPDRLFARDEQAFYLAFARALGYPDDARPLPQLPIGPGEAEARVGVETVILAPGCKTGTMSAKRWPHFAALATRFADVVVVGTADDLRHHDGRPMEFPAHVRSLVDRLSLRETAELMAAAALVVGNDSGLSHVAAAVGVTTLMLFGPTDHSCLGPLPPNVMVLRAGLPCEPCWQAAPLAACGRRIDCLAQLDVEHVARAARSLMSLPGEENRDDHAGVRAF